MPNILVQHDTAPPINATLRKSTGAALDLTTATSVEILMRRSNDLEFAIHKACTITDTVNGKVTYQPVTPELSIPGDYLLQYEVHWNDGTVQSTTNEIPVTVRVK